MRHLTSMLASIALALPPMATAAAPVSQDFTYQGQLTQNGSPVNGPVVLRFTLWDAGSGGNQVATFGSQTQTVQAANGAFTVTLNAFGGFDAGDARWLQIAVCPDVACASPTTLTPRQPLTSTPFAHYALLPWHRSGDDDLWVPLGTRIGIGASTPQAELHVRGDLLAGAVGEEWIFHTRSSWAGDFLHITDQDGGAPQFQHGLIVAESGNVGIGTTAPASLLDVRGSVRLGNNGEMFAPGSPENLRIVRGVVNFDGAAPSGCCFSVSHPTTGQYDITFAQAFQSQPSVVASSTTTGGLVNVVALNNSSVRIIIRNSTNTNVINGGFHFIAMGER